MRHDLGFGREAFYQKFMRSAHFSELVTCLNADQPPRVWSLLVTVFGELAQEEGARISGALLHNLSDLIGLKPEAVRVALYRLRKDGWIESQRQGRNSDYCLTAWGRAQSVKASPRIYAEGPLAENAWLIVREPVTGLPSYEGEGVSVSPNVELTSRHPADDRAFVAPVCETVPLPAWMTRQVCDESTVELANRLDQGLGRLVGNADKLASLNVCERAALRVLIVHEWRRIVLKLPLLPDHVFPKDCGAIRCRFQVGKTLRLLPKVGVEVLEQSISP